MSVSRFEQMLERNPYWGPVLLTLFTAALFLPGLGARDFWAPGEPIYGEVIRVMYERNDWLVPQLNGQIYADKPALYFWLALILSKIAGGVNEWTVRLPAALAGVGLVLVTYQFGKTFYDRQAGFLSGLVLATSSRLFWESRFLRLDTVLSFFLFLGFYLFLKAFTQKGSEKNYLFAYLCFALATLTKGPIGLALPGLAILGLIAFDRQWRRIREIRLVSGCIVVALVIVPWLGLLHLRGEDQWLRDFIWTHNIQNYALEPIGHVRPFYYYFVNLPPDFLPWTLFIPGALSFYFPWRERLRNLATLGLVCWFAAIFIFFGLSKSKIAYYLLPLLPSLAILVGCYWSALIRNKSDYGMNWRLTAWFLLLLAAMFGLTGLTLPLVAYRLERGLFFWALTAGAVLVGGSLSMFLFFRRKQLEYLLCSFLAVLFGASVIAGVGVLPYLDKYKSPRAVGEAVRFRMPTESPVYVFQSTMADFNYYARREQIPVVASAEDLRKLSGSGARLIISDKDLKQNKLNMAFKIVTQHQIGEKKWYLIELS